MFKKSIAAVISITMVLTPFAALTVSAETIENNAAVSAYVSMTNENGGLELVSPDKTPAIYVDDKDFEGVRRAAGDLKEDINTITNKMPSITNDISLKETQAEEGISIDNGVMTVTIDSAPIKDAQCFVASYDSAGALNAVKKSTNMIAANSSGKVFTFDNALQKPSGGKMKAFVWSDDMEPLKGVLGMKTAGTIELNGIDIVVGTLGMSTAVDALAQSSRIDISGIEGQWESFTIQNVDDTLVIAGSDKRGTIYGIYDLCEKIGVSPWSFWADVVPGHADSLYINLPDGGYTEGEPSVQYRGIFLNDEFNMSEWSKSMGNTGKNMNNATYEKLFELLLRLKANYLWPAMHTYSTAFNVTEGNAALADQYGIVMGSSHAEPLLRNNLGELYDYQEAWKAKAENKGKALNTKTADGKSTIKDDANRTVAYMWTDKDNDSNAVANKEFLTDYWRERAKANGNYENTYTLGMRGVHDGGFSTNMDSQAAMKEILETQTQILKDEVAKEGQDISAVPQVFIPYKEMLDMYNKGLDIPDYVTLMWPDDNFGYIRQLPTEKERERSGGAGIYYHLSYYGRPTSYLWLSTTQPGLIREEMTKAYDMGAQKIWIANVGDLKPAETEIEYFLDLARDVDTMRNMDISGWLAENAKRDFGFDNEKAAEYAGIKQGYYQNAAARRPEHFINGLFSTGFGDEGQKLIDGYAGLEQRAQALYNGLSEDQKPSFYELLLYPLKGAKNMAEKYVYSDKAKLYAEKGYGSAANKYAKLSDDAYQRVVDDTREYTAMLGGKWDKMMNPYQTRLTGSFGGTVTGKLDNPAVSELPYTNMEIVPEGGIDLSFTRYSTEPKYVDIINTGTGSFEWTAETDAEWITMNKSNGTVADDDRIYISTDLSKAENGSNSAYITFTRKLGNTDIQTFRVNVALENTAVSAAEEKTYIENDGFVSIEAEHYTRSITNGGYEWKVEKDFGRSGDSVKIYPDTAKAVTTPNKNNSAYLEYDVYFTSAGTFPVDVYRMPALNEVSGSTMRCNIGIDDNTPVRFSGNTKAKDKSDGTDVWGKGVLQNSDIVSGTITVPSAGLHTVRLYNESPGVVVDKFVITTGEKKASYFGAPQSYNTTYNNQMKPLPAPSEASEEQTGSITALFEPQAMITNVTGTEVTVVKLAENESRDNLLLVAAYDKDGNMLGHSIISSFSQFENLGINESIHVPYQKPDLEGTVQLQYMILGPSHNYQISDRKPIAPAVTIDLPQAEDASFMASYDNGYAYPSVDMQPYTARESVCYIAEYSDTLGETVKYIRQSTVREDTYKKIPFYHKGQYKLKISIAGVDDIIEEDLNTIINITPDNEATLESAIYDQPLDSDPALDNALTLNGASYDSAKKAVNMGAGGAVSVDLDEPVTMAQGDTITTSFKIAHAKENGKFMDWAIKDSSGKSIAAVHVSAYNGTTTSHWMSVGDEKVYENKGSLTQAILRTKDGEPGGYTTYTVTVNCATGAVAMTISSDNGTEGFAGKLPDGTSYDIDRIEFSTDYTNALKSCLVKDILITKSKEASYNITFVPVDKSTRQPIENTVVTVTDAVTGAVITPIDGKYALCQGNYSYTAVADGYAAGGGMLNLSPATESKEIIVEMEHN